MRAAVYYGPEDIRVEDVPKPEIGPGEMLVKVAGCGLCGSDIVKIRHQTVEPPAVFGHEVVGTVDELGAGVESFGVGERVVVAHHVPCYSCHYCRHQSYSMCRTFKSLNVYPGGFAEYVRVPSLNVAHGVFRIPEHLSYEDASFTEPIACCLRAIKRSRLQPMDTLVVMGLGSIGLLMVQLAKIFGARVIGVDVLPGRVELAKEIGADMAIDASSESLKQRVFDATEGIGADGVMMAAGTPRSLAQAFDLVRDGGTINMFAGAPPGATITKEINSIYHRELTILASYSPSTIELWESLRLLSSGAVNVSRLLSHRVPLEELNQVVGMAISQKALKAYILMDTSN